MTAPSLFFDALFPLPLLLLLLFDLFHLLLMLLLPSPPLSALTSHATRAANNCIRYQGESNVACNDEWPYMQGLNCAMSPADCASYYSCQFPAMIADWRTRFATPWVGTPHELTFLYVGLPAYVQDLPSMLYDKKVDTSLPLLRLSQAAAEAQNHTFGTSLIDHVSDFRHRPSFWLDPGKTLQKPCLLPAPSPTRTLTLR